MYAFCSDYAGEAEYSCCILLSVLQYLLNLDVNSAHYDPKTRAMRGNPLAGTSKDPTTS